MLLVEMFRKGVPPAATTLEKILDFLDICCQECIQETQKGFPDLDLFYSLAELNK